jgi:hypothetical protein
MLELLASSRDGCTESSVAATIENDGLAYWR